LKAAADKDLRAPLDKIGEGARSVLNNFNGLRKKPSRQYPLDTTTMSNLEGKVILIKNHGTFLFH